MMDTGATEGAVMRDKLTAEALGVEMATMAVAILNKDRDEEGDGAVFAAVLGAANDCLGRFDRRPADQRWCDALLQILELAEQPPVALGVSAA
jgi:hypothetical protein